MKEAILYISRFKEIKVWKIKFGILAAHFISKQVKKKKERKTDRVKCTIHLQQPGNVLLEKLSSKYDLLN